NLTAGVGYSWTDSKTSGNVTAAVPDPLLFDSLRTVSAAAGEVKHREQAIHFTGTWMIPVTDKMDVGVAFGPTLFLVSQDVPSSVNVTEPGPSVTAVGVESLDESTVGFHLGVDVTYMINKRFGVGGLARYAMGSVNIANAADKLNVGGFQIGGGLRVRF
ncbi:MAG: hypothetical protein ABIP65_10120, partial [Vicinamibacterales bacterium]